MLRIVAYIGSKKKDRRCTPVQGLLFENVKKFPCLGRLTPWPLRPALYASPWGQICSESPSNVAHDVTYLLGPDLVRTHCAANRTAKALVISALGATIIRSPDMISPLLVPMTCALKYCSVHQRAWSEALGRWVAVSELTMDGSPVIEVACDTCTACVFQTFQAQFPALYASAS